MNAVAGHLMRPLSPAVVHVTTGHCHQYFTMRKPPGQHRPRVVACDGLGYVHPGHIENYLPDQVEQSIERLLSRTKEQTNG